MSTGEGPLLPALPHVPHAPHAPPARLRFLFAVLLLDLDKARAGSAKDEGEAEEYGEDGADDVVVVDNVLVEPHKRKPVNVAEKERVEGVLLGGRGDTRVKVEGSLQHARQSNPSGDHKCEAVPVWRRKGWLGVGLIVLPLPREPCCYTATARAQCQWTQHTAHCALRTAPHRAAHTAHTTHPLRARTPSLN